MLTRRLPLTLPHRLPTLLRPLSTTPHHHTTFKPTPGPPRLPKSDQETYESLTKSSTGAFSHPPPDVNISNMSEKELADLIAIEEKMEHKDLLKGGEKPLFEGDRNPVTGEVGGPKTDPLKYGDWSFNGKVTDF
ncbi:hypothetical protein ABW19_dt0200563 [Dactylella cylindrospora]|nr:hypothetical protein ABW19_dt0200563 [Dactylella cylindrospora]